nr:galactose oxidase early set domain-containing protein [Cupriavidus sp. IK-TO18]
MRNCAGAAPPCHGRKKSCAFWRIWPKLDCCGPQARQHQTTTTNCHDSCFPTPGISFAVTMNSSVTAFSLIRLSSVTHSLNNELRRVPVSRTVGTAGEYLINVPSNPGIVVPGYYLLFALNKQGVLSVAKTLRVH